MDKCYKKEYEMLGAITSLITFIGGLIIGIVLSILVVMIMKQMEKIVDLKRQRKIIDDKLKNAYFDYHIAMGFTVKQAEGMI
jgi:hypothetical protein